MPQMVSGFGTRYLGECDYSGQTYVTTEWFVFALLPVFPLRSLRVGPSSPEHSTRDAEKYSAAYAQKTYVVYKSLPLHRWQVARTYAFTVFQVAWMALCVTIFWQHWRTNETNVAFAILLLVCAVPFLVPPILRLRARSKAASGTHN